MQKSLEIHKNNPISASHCILSNRIVVEIYKIKEKIFKIFSNLMYNESMEKNAFIFF